MCSAASNAVALLWTMWLQIFVVCQNLLCAIRMLLVGDIFQQKPEIGREKCKCQIFYVYLFWLSRISNKIFLLIFGVDVLLILYLCLDLSLGDFQHTSCLLLNHATVWLEQPNVLGVELEKEH